LNLSLGAAVFKNLGHPAPVHAVGVANNLTIANTIASRIERGGNLSMGMLDIIVGVEPAGLLHALTSKVSKIQKHYSSSNK
jgi:hypothetical protein